MKLQMKYMVAEFHIRYAVDDITNIETILMNTKDKILDCSSAI
ncbi:hypothetical protein EG68_11422 [Paragonimus skrjabini miyazakii]|uniref:Uncharacterized protein n=1 Tax=Paragonimus skrjabini miyazakii TaxID=59628 RepID=A0A8S9YJP9_9TREM|nr:hypothetical protein EG68_11422 [Paragonimus skrjabini miyazakii]